MPGPQLTGKQLLAGLCCGPGMPGPYASTMFYHAITAHVPGTVKTVPYKAPARGSIVGRGLDPSAAAVCHCDAVGAGHVRPAT